MKLEVPVMATADRRTFVDFWARFYRYPKEEQYSENVGKSLTARRVLVLFEWKNGRPLSRAKKATVKGFLSDARLPSRVDDESLRRYLLRPGGPIWRIFWLHLQQPDRFPIFDQHVYRAMARVTGHNPREVPARPAAKIEAYLNDYLPFWRGFRDFDPRRVDRALWTYGKFVVGRLRDRESNCAIQLSVCASRPLRSQGPRRTARR